MLISRSTLKTSASPLYLHLILILFWNLLLPLLALLLELVFPRLNERSEDELASEPPKSSLSVQASSSHLKSALILANIFLR